MGKNILLGKKIKNPMKSFKSINLLINLEGAQRIAKAIFYFRNCLIENKLYSNVYELRPTPTEEQHKTSVDYILL